MMTINEKETTPIKMDDKMLNGKSGNKQQDIFGVGRSLVFRENFKNDTKKSQCTCLEKYYFPRQYLEVKPEYYCEHCKGFENDVKAVYFRHCTLHRLAKPADVNCSVTQKYIKHAF